MIAALIFMSLSGWGFWLMYRDVQYPRMTTPVARRISAPPAPPRSLASRTMPISGAPPAAPGPHWTSTSSSACSRTPRHDTDESHHLNRRSISDVSTKGPPQ